MIIVIRGFVVALLAAALTAAASAHHRPTATHARAFSAHVVVAGDAPAEGKLYIMVDGVLYEVGYKWTFTGGQWWLVVVVVRINPAPNAPTVIDERGFPMGPGGPMPCSDCDDLRIRRVLDPNGNGKPYWADPGEPLRPSYNIE